MEPLSGSIRCERTWRIVDPYSGPAATTYRQHRCGEAGRHTIHVCRYCGRMAKARGSSMEFEVGGSVTPP